MRQSNCDGSVVRRSCSTLSLVSSGMGDRLRAGIPPWYVTKPTRSTQPCIPLGSLNRVLALFGWGKGGNVTSAGWQVTLCDPIWHASSRSGVVLVAQTAIRFFTFIPLLYTDVHSVFSVSSWVQRRAVQKWFNQSQFGARTCTSAKNMH